MPRGEFDRSARRSQTRSKLLAAAADVYAREGFDAATLDAVADEAGFTKGAVYDHFGSKDNLLFALLDEHLATQIAEQISLFDLSTEAAERPRAGADRWMEHLEHDPRPFQLLVEAWVHGQRDEGLRDRVAAGMEAWRSTLRGFGAEHDIEGEDLQPDPRLLDGIATIMLGLGIGLGMVKLTDPASVPPQLLGATFVLMLRTLETSEQARELLRSAAGGSEAPA
jgi:AcrR family transcriptional regulator